MRSLSRFVVLAAVAALAVPALASAAPIAKLAKRGIVVQRDSRAGAVVLATRSGNLLRVSMAKPNHLAMGSLVQVRGTRVSVVGHAHKAKLRGVVVRRSRHSFALAGGGSVLAVASVNPPAAGQTVATTVQVTPTSLSDDDGEVEVENDQAATAEIRGTVASQTSTTLVLTVDHFPAGLSIALGTVVVPTLAQGTPVEAHVALGPDPANPANPAAIVLTLVSLRLDGGHHGEHGDHGDHGSMVEASGLVTDLKPAGAAGGAPGSITIADEHGSVTFVIPAGFDTTGVAVNDRVEAKGSPGATPGAQPSLVRLESADDESGH
ncbi:MAG: hypothetical protein QOH95_2901, partial [Gaiellaceae bacterium]|nr:hypothetical protein [Gaiellaceae bacterium]